MLEPKSHLQALLQDLAGDADAGADDGARAAGDALHLHCEIAAVPSAPVHARVTTHGAVSGIV
jgi:hypothetical protein